MDRLKKDTLGRMFEWYDTERSVRAREAELMTPYQQAKVAAEQGNIQPLREYLAEHHEDPDLKRFIDLPRLNVGQNWNRARDSRHVQPPMIAEWAVVIRAIWRDHFGNKRRGRDEWTAEEFAFTLLMKDATGEWPKPLREPYPDDPDEKRWSDRAAEQNRRGK
jgi:hypothetical protein